MGSGCRAEPHGCLLCRLVRGRLRGHAQDVLFEDTFADLSNWNTAPGWTGSEGVLFVAGGPFRPGVTLTLDLQVVGAQ